MACPKSSMARAFAVYATASTCGVMVSAFAPTSMTSQLAQSTRRVGAATFHPTSITAWPSLLVREATVVEEDVEDDLGEMPELLDDPFEGAGEEDLLASFDLDAADVGDVAEWDALPKAIVEQQRAQDRATWARHDKDSGSPEVQIAMFTTRIKHITKHVIDNPKDHASRRGLLALVSKRRRLLHYYFSKSPEKAENLATELGVRFRFRNQMPSRTEKYRQYANAKRK